MQIKRSQIYFMFVLFLSFFLLGCSFAPGQKLSKAEMQELVARAQQSKLIILDVYHNRCESCKHIEPVFEQLKEKYSTNKDITFLKYDLSNPFTILDSLKIAKALGIQDIYKAQRFSGIVLLIDPKEKKVIDTLIAEYNFDKYINVIESLLKEAPKGPANET